MLMQGFQGQIELYPCKGCSVLFRQFRSIPGTAQRCRVAEDNKDPATLELQVPKHLPRNRVNKTSDESLWENKLHRWVGREAVVANLTFFSPLHCWNFLSGKKLGVYPGKEEIHPEAVMHTISYPLFWNLSALSPSLDIHHKNRCIYTHTHTPLKRSKVAKDFHGGKEKCYVKIYALISLIPPSPIVCNICLFGSTVNCVGYLCKFKQLKHSCSGNLHTQRQFSQCYNCRLEHPWILAAMWGPRPKLMWIQKAHCILKF